ncbi:TonB-dependent receptor [Vibrio sp. PP-XX7]
MLYGSLTLSRKNDYGDFINQSTGSDDLGGSENELGSLKLRLAPDDQPWESNLAISNSCTEASQDTYLDYNDVDGRTLSTNSGSPDPYLKRCTHSQSLSGSYTTEDWIIHLVTAFQQQDYQRSFPNGSLVATMPETWDQNIQGIRVATQGEHRRIDAVFGLYRQYTKEKLNLSYDLLSGSNYQTTDSHHTAQTLAAYSDLTWHVTEQWNIGGGLRFSHDEAKTNYNISQTGTDYRAQNSLNDNQLLGQISTGYQVSPSLLVYSRIAQGYKPAGFNITPAASSTATPYQEEKSLNYEIGSRYQKDDLQLHGAVFHTQTRNMQLYSGAAGIQTLSNAGTANATGLELSSSWQFMPVNMDINGLPSALNLPAVAHSMRAIKFLWFRHSAGGTSLSGFIDTTYGILTPAFGGKHCRPTLF